MIPQSSRHRKVPAPENETAEVAAAGNVPTAEEPAALEFVHLEIASDETEEIDLPLGAAPIEPTVIDAVGEAGTEELAVAEAGGAVPASPESIFEPAVHDSPAPEPIVPDPAATDLTAPEIEVERRCCIA